MKKVKMSSLNLLSSINGTVKTTVTHPDLFYTIFGEGLSAAIVNNLNSGTPDSQGVILHAQRYFKGDTTSTNTIYQLFLCSSGVYERHRTNVVAPIEYSQWVKL